MAEKDTSTGTRSARVARELDQLRKKVKELALKLEREAKSRKIGERLAMEAKKGKEQLTKQLKTVRERERRLAAELKSTLGDAGKREQALKEARAKVAELRAGLALKTADLKRRSLELKKLAAASGHRAVEIMRGRSEPGAPPVQTEPSPVPPASEPSPQGDATDEPKLT